MGSQSEHSIAQPFSMQTLARSLFRWRLIRPTPNGRSVFLRLASRSFLNESFLKSMGVVLNNRNEEQRPPQLLVVDREGDCRCR